MEATRTIINILLRRFDDVRRVNAHTRLRGRDNNRKTTRAVGRPEQRAGKPVNRQQS